jgi:hypothetical protein
MLPFTDDDRAHIMIYALWDATKGTHAERKQQMTDAILTTTRANPKIKGERLFFLTLEWLRSSRVVA